MKTNKYFQLALVVILTISMFFVSETFANVTKSTNHNSDAIPAGKKFAKQTSHVMFEKSVREFNDALPAGKRYAKRQSQIMLEKGVREFNDALPAGKRFDRVNELNFFHKLFEATQNVNLWYYVQPFFHVQPYHSDKENYNAE
jgi:hypothetical protein